MNLHNPVSFCPRNNRRQLRGTALIFSVIATLVITSLSMAWISTSLARSGHTKGTIQKLRVNAIAEAGLNCAIADLVAGGSGTLGVTQEWNAEYSDTGGIAARGVLVGANDGLPTPGEPGVEMIDFGSDAGYLTWCEEGNGGDSYRIFASAEQNGVISTIASVVERVKLPAIPGAVYLQWADVDLSYNGNAFTIDGHDSNWDDSAGPRPPLPGIATPWDPDWIASTIPKGRQDQVKGAGDDPSTGSAPFLDLRKVGEGLKSTADNLVQGGTYTGSWGNHLTDDFQITYVDGDFHQSGNGHGAGILVVDGDLRLSGSFVWYGAIIVLGEVQVVGGGGSKHVYGGVFVGDDIVEVGLSEFGITGTSDIYYSSQSEDALKKMRSFRLTNWEQIR